MIKLFRRIREKLIGDGKIRKYLIYAIGEILLVVIGILIALQVNNWNEDRVRARVERELLGKLKNEFIANQNTLIEFIPKIEKINTDLVSLIQHTGPDAEAIHDDSLYILLDALAYIPTYIPKQEVLNSAFNSGTYSSVANEHLLLQISRWQSTLKVYEIQGALMNQLYHREVLPYMTEKVPVKNLGQVIGVIDYGQSKFRLDSKEILSDIRLENMAATKLIDSEPMELTLGDLHDIQAQILETLNKYLNR